MLGGRGDLDGRLHELKVAQELDPLYRIVSMEIGQTLAALGRVDEAIAELRGTIDMDDSFVSGHIQLGTLYVMKGMPTEGVREMQRALQLSGDRQASFLAYLASAYAASGQLDSARALINELNPRAKREYVPAVAFAIAFAGLGDKDTAFGWLDKAIENHEGILAEAWFDPSFESLHSDPRWAGVLARLGVVIKQQRPS